MIEIVNEMDVRALAYADRHYSRKTVGARRMGGPGEKLILLDSDNQFVIGFRRNLYRKDGQTGIECFIFRNEGKALSSESLTRAWPYVLAKWGHTRVFTYVSPGKIRSVNPGYCFKMAGFTLCGTNRYRRPCEYKVILEKYL